MVKSYFSLSYLPNFFYSSSPSATHSYFGFPPCDCFYYENLYSFLVLCRRVNNEISRLKKFTSDSRASRRCPSCFLRRSSSRFELLDQPYLGENCNNFIHGRSSSTVKFAMIRYFPRKINLPTLYVVSTERVSTVRAKFINYIPHRNLTMCQIKKILNCNVLLSAFRNVNVCIDKSIYFEELISPN